MQIQRLNLTAHSLSPRKSSVRIHKQSFAKKEYLSTELYSPQHTTETETRRTSRSPPKSHFSPTHRCQNLAKGYKVCSSDVVFVFSRKKIVEHEEIILRSSGNKRSTNLFREPTSFLVKEETFAKRNSAWPRFRIHAANNGFGFNPHFNKSQDLQGRKSAEPVVQFCFNKIDPWELSRERTEIEELF